MRLTSATSPGTEYQRYIALGITDGGRRIVVIFSFTDESGVRPIAAWERE